jgi:hypothetical protein
MRMEQERRQTPGSKSMPMKSDSNLRQARSPWRRLAHCALLALPLAAGLHGQAHAGFSVFDSAGANAAAITPARDDFRTAVGGGSTAAANGDFGGVRREINWDGVPDARADPTALPANFFNVNSPRGVVFSSPDAGAGFLVSSTAASGQPVLFGFPGDLQTFSAQRLFATTNSRVTDIQFFVPGTNTAATTSAFAAIFVDVEDNNASIFTNMEFFDQNNALIFSHNVLSTGNQGLSFLGGVANSGERISRVRITTPNNFLLSNGSRLNESTDFVVMDDFLYATPAAVPEPEIWAMVLLGLGVVGWRSRRRA